MTHGLYSWKDKGIAPVCDSRCPATGCSERVEYAEGDVPQTCAIIAELRAEMIAACCGMAHINRELHRPLVEEYATVRAMMWRCDLWISIYDVAAPNGAPGSGTVDVQPLVNARARLSSQFVSLASELLVTPAAEARMKAESKDTVREVLAGLVGAALSSGDVERVAQAMGIEDGDDPTPSRDDRRAVV